MSDFIPTKKCLSEKNSLFERGSPFKMYMFMIKRIGFSNHVFKKMDSALCFFSERMTFQKAYSTGTLKMGVYPGSRIPDPDFFPIPDHGFSGQKNTGSRSGSAV